MAFVPLNLPNVGSSALIQVATEEHLKQAHYLLAATHPSDGQTPDCHFGTSAAVMTLLTIAAVSVLRYFDLDANRRADHRKDRAAKSDRDAFIETVETFFPWGNVTIEDDKYRPKGEMPKLAALELYEVFRNPLVHVGGMTSKPWFKGRADDFFRTPKISHTFPGLATPRENEAVIADYCKETLCGDVLLRMEAFQSIVYSGPLYWCTRKMIENFAADPQVQQDIASRFFQRN
jgi:hypothetical protein